MRPRTDELVQLIERGCYRCLETAFAGATARGATQQAFEAAVLLALRSKELGIPGSLWPDRAQMLAGDDGEWQQIVEMIGAVPADALSGDRDALLRQTSGPIRSRSLLPLWRDALRTGSTSAALRAYIDLSLECTLEPRTQRDQPATAPPEPSPNVALLHYRAGICSSDGDRLTAFRAANAEFVDADYGLGRFELQKGQGQDQDKAMRLLQAAAAAFPGSTAIATSIGNLYQSWEEWAPALAAYDRALAVVSAHTDALLGRTIALSHLDRSEEAIATATRLIEGQWFVGQAYYWRGWNQLDLGNFDAARADVDSARKLMVNPALFLLSGLVDWRLRRLESADKEFEQALSMDFGQCDAAFYLGVVRDAAIKVPESVAAFKQARQCYDLAITVRQQLIANIAAGPASEGTKARQIEGQQRAIRQSESRRGDAIKAIDTLEAYLTRVQARPQSPAR
jgi:tetratricopeptide (TPR) repeat protein